MESERTNKKYMIQTLVFIRDENKVLLGRKKRGFGEGEYV